MSGKTTSSFIQEVVQSGSRPVASDIQGSGNDTLALGAPVFALDFWNGGGSMASISSGGVTRYVPAGLGRLCVFPVASDSFDVVAGGDWLAVPSE